MFWLIMFVLSTGTLQAASVGIVGGGASGLLSAWMLEQEHDVTVFEKTDRFGGHAHTIDIQLGDKFYPVDAGFEFFSDTMHPTLVSLLSILDVPKYAHPLNYAYFKEDGSRTIVLPPIVEGKMNYGVFWPSTLIDLVQMKIMLQQGKKIVKNRDTSITFEEFGNSCFLSQTFCDEFLYPFFAGTWMVSVESIKKFAAYDLLRWMYEYSPACLSAIKLHEVIGGTRSYINGLINQMQNTTLKSCAEVEKISFEDGKYIVRLKNDESYSFDHLIISTEAHIAINLIPSVPHAEEIRSLLGLLEYNHMKMALHGDTSYMAPNKSDWTLFNVRLNADGACSTVYKPWGCPEQYPVFRTCISYAPDVPLPQPLYALLDFSHPLATPGFFKAQEGIGRMQGQENLWFTGFYLNDADSHESALMSAVEVVKKLNPTSPRLNELIARKKH